MAKDQFTRDDLKRIEWEEPGETLLSLPGPSKQELLDAICDGDGEEFVALFVAHFDMMARFVPTLDKIFRKRGRKDSNAE